VQLQEAIGTSLEYFQELEHATRLLNHPGESLVLQTDFLYMVERVDICIEFLKSHVSNDYHRSLVCLNSRSYHISPTN
jgi:conserved oligomeric Golgi complex subunit 3